MTKGCAPLDLLTPAGLDRFLLLLIHDLRSPLRQSMLRAQLLERATAETINTESASHLSAVLEANRLVDKLLSRLAEYCNAGADASAAPQIGVDLALNNAVRMIGNDPEVSLIVESVPEIPVASFLQKVFFELIDNARKFRHGPAAIRILNSQSDSEVIFEVQDNGVGYDPEFAGNLWAPLQRLHGVGDFPGFGFGLAICRRIVSGMGGRTWSRSIPGQGSSFFFSLPLS